MRKTMTLLLTAVCLLAVLSGCGSKKELEPQTFVEELLAEANFVDSLNQLDDPVIPLLYEIDEADYASALVYCGTGATAEEIAVFQAEDEAAAKRLLEAAHERVARQIEVYEAYGPVEAMSLENAVVERAGTTVIVVICSDSDGAKKVVDKYI